jgi:hypothetical protein
MTHCLKSLAAICAVLVASASWAADSICSCPPTGCQPCLGTYGTVEALFLDRDNRTDRLAVIQVQGEGNPLPGAPVITTDALNFDWQPGVRALVGWQFDDYQALEIGYFGVFGWSASASAAANNSLAIPGDLGLAALDYFAADAIRLNYSSALHSAEANYVYSYDDFSLLAGFRYVSLDERFNLNATDADTSSSDYSIRTSNDLYGGQIGAQWFDRWDVLDLLATGKAGIFGNAASQSQSVADFPPSFFLRTERTGRRGNVAFVGDVNLSAGYRLDDIWSVRGGYNLIWIEGVALGPEQLDFTDTTASGRDVSLGGIFLHGLNLGLDARW